jgi:hypothetical protein
MDMPLRKHKPQPEPESKPDRDAELQALMDRIDSMAGGKPSMATFTDMRSVSAVDFWRRYAKRLDAEALDTLKVLTNTLERNQ